MRADARVKPQDGGSGNTYLKYVKKFVKNVLQFWTQRVLEEIFMSGGFYKIWRICADIEYVIPSVNLPEYRDESNLNAIYPHGPLSAQFTASFQTNQRHAFLNSFTLHTIHQIHQIHVPVNNHSRSIQHPASGLKPLRI